MSRAAPAARVPVRVPRRPEAAAPVRVAPLRALAGAGLAVAAVALGIGALLLFTDDPEDTPTAAPAAAGALDPVDQPGPPVGDAPAAPAPSDASEPAERDAPQVDAPSDGATDEATTDDATDDGAEDGATDDATEDDRAPDGAAADPEPDRATTTTTAAPPPSRAAAPSRPAVTVLNNSRYTGLAARQAETLREAGWPVALVGNLRGRTRTSTVYYEDGQRAAAERLARTHGFPRVLPRREGLPGEGLTVVVTSDRA